MIKVFSSGPFDTNAYIIFCPETKVAAIIDPAPESAERLLESIQINGFKVDKIILTHSHWDHFGDLATVKEKLEVPVYVHPLDQANLESPGSDGLPMFMPILGVLADQLLNDGQMISIGTLNFQVIHTPGHSPGGICLYCKDENILISGDTLFKGTIGNLSFPTASPEDMWKSLEKLAKLPPETQVFPGHGDSTTIEDESWLSNAKKHFS
ncbi:MAG: Hydroxyacylglutathione hydrolase GloC [Chlamydiae bacterium]|nr:Hydroxyacylglutathione hydrolase GloC [Chlamydiota bacterium]